jgi:lipopolysaccharide transport system permease protein
MIISALSIRHRDLIYGLPFIFQMLIFLSPVLYPLNNTINSYNSFFFIFNPFSSLVELFRFIFIKDYVLLFNIIIINFVEILVLSIVGFQMFKRVEKTVQDLI